MTAVWMAGGLALVLCALGVGFAFVWLRHRQHIALAQARAQLQRAEARLITEQAAAKAAAQQASAAERARTQFFLAAGHDLRQPLHALGLFADSLSRQVDVQRGRVSDPLDGPDGPVGLPADRAQSDAEAARLARSIVESVAALEGLFDDVLDFTRIDSGQVEVSPRAFALSDLHARLRLRFEPLAFDQGLTLDFRGGQHAVVADPVLLERIVANLLANALRYTPDGGVLVSGRVRGGQVLLQVWDSGVGIAPQDLARVFDAFYQVAGSRPLVAPHRKGMGLGLSIVERLAGLIGTQVTVRSQAGRGSVFSMLLPAAPAGWRNAAGAAPSPWPQLTLHGRRIVLVEPDPSTSQHLRGLLEGWGARVIAFDQAPPACEWASLHAQEPPDLLILAHAAPAAPTDGACGIPAIDAFRAAWGVDLPVVVTAEPTLSDADARARACGSHVLIKPVQPNRLRALVSFKLAARPG